MTQHCSVTTEEKVEIKTPIKNKVDSEKCPKCFKRFSVLELPTHMQ
jgi:hypothetical protein